MAELNKIQYFALVNKISTGIIAHSVIFCLQQHLRLEWYSRNILLSCHKALLTSAAAELENHLGIAEKSLAEFIVEIAKDKTSVKHFDQVRIGCRLIACCSSSALHIQHHAVLHSQFAFTLYLFAMLYAGSEQGGRQAANLPGGDTMDHHTAHEGPQTLLPTPEFI